MGMGRDGEYLAEGKRLRLLSQPCGRAFQRMAPAVRVRFEAAGQLLDGPNPFAVQHPPREGSDPRNPAQIIALFRVLLAVFEINAPRAARCHVPLALGW